MPLRSPLRQDLRCLRDIEPCASSAFILPFLEVLVIQGQIPHLQEHRELHLDSAIPGVLGGAQELVGVPSGQPDQQRSSGTAQRTFQLPLGNTRRPDWHWSLQAAFKQSLAIVSIYECFHYFTYLPNYFSIVLTVLQPLLNNINT